MRLVILFSAALAVGEITPCSLTSDWPRWAESLASQLECGMDLGEINALAGREVRKGSNVGPYSRYIISRGGSRKLWLYIADQGLESIGVSRDMRRQFSRLSPLQNLCTGRQQFLLRVSRTKSLEGATIYINGERVQEERDIWSGQFLLDAGEYELRVEKKGLGAGTAHLSLGPEDRGDQSVFLRLCDAEGLTTIHAVQIPIESSGAVLDPDWCDEVSEEEDPHD